MKKNVYGVVMTLVNFCYALLSYANPFKSQPEESYLFESVNVITGEYVESHNDMILAGPYPYSIKRSHTRKDAFLYGWQTNAPNLINAPIKKGAGEWTGHQVIAYEFDESNRLVGLKTQDSLCETVYNSFQVNYSENACHITTQDQQSLIYKFLNRYLISEVSSSRSPTIRYQYNPHPQKEGYILHKRSLPDGRFLEFEYDEYGRVITQKAPTGTDSQPQVVYRFIYHQNFTEVFDALNCKTIYRFLPSGLMSSIECYDEKKQFIRSEHFHWTPSDENKKAQISSRYITDGKIILYARSYAYNKDGDLIKETLFGNLSGDCAFPINIDSYGKVSLNGIESYSIQYAFSNKLVTEVKEDNGKKIIYLYEEGKNQPKAKLTTIDDQIILREFYNYNASLQLIKLVVDNGSSYECENLNDVTERHIQNVNYRTEFPVGLVSSVEDAYLDLSSQQEVLIKRIENQYNFQAKVEQQDVFDSHGSLQFSLINRYDEKARLIFKINETGQALEFEYDENDNILSEIETNPNGSFKQKIKQYDFSNRLIAQEERHSNQNSCKTTFRYNNKGILTAKTDALGNETILINDALGREIKRISPCVLDEDDKPCIFTHEIEYDSFDQIVKETDAKGTQTIKTYNARGEISTEYRLGVLQKKNNYFLDGSLKSSTDPQGTNILYERDALGRNKKIIYQNNVGKVLKTINFHYNAFHLLKAEESTGLSITYKYNDAGQLIELIQKQNEVPFKQLNYFYNERGLQTRVEDRNGHQELQLITSKEFDYFNHLEKTTIENPDGSYREVIPVNKPETPLIYESEELDSLGQKVISKKVYDERGSSTTTTYDAIGKPSKIIVRNSIGETLSIKEQRWDANQRKISERNYFNENEFSTTIWKYNHLNQLSHLIEGYKSKEQKITSYSYNEKGLLESIEKPDGIKLFYTYNSLGLLTSLKSSDPTIHYTYLYDEQQNLIEVQDLIHKTLLKRIYSKEGLLIQEIQDNQLSTTRNYDLDKKVTKLELFDGSSINYVYEGSFLKEVERISHSGDSYKYDYKTRTLKGKSLEKGPETHLYDDEERLIGIQTKSWSENLTYDSSLNQIETISYQQKDASTTYHYAYDEQQRILSEIGSNDQYYKYDWLGNIVEHNENPKVYNSLSQLIEQQNSHYQYDKNGNQKNNFNNDEESSLSYDALNRLNEVRKQDGSFYRYTYDAFHRRMTKQEFDIQGQLVFEEKYLYDGQKEIAATNAKNEITHLRVMGEGLSAEIGASVLLEIEGKVFYPIHDHRGSICVLLDYHTEEVAEVIQYNAFGEEYSKEISISPWRFSSKRFDPETGFIYFGKRYYSAKQNRWLTQDPLFDIEGANTYGFVSNNPILKIDSYGLFSIDSLDDSANGSFDFFESIDDFIKENLSWEHKLNDHLEEAAIALFGKTFLGLMGFYQHESEVGSFGEKELSDKVRVTLINGILNARHDLQDTLEEISRYHGGYKIHYIFRPTEGWTKDAIKSFFVKWGWTSPQAKQLANRWKELIAEMGGISGGGKILHYAHSIGATDTAMAKHLLSPEEQAMIQVYTIGSPTLISSGGFQSVMNYVSFGDAICYFDPINYIRALIAQDRNVQFLKSSWGLPMIDHQLSFPTYQKILEDLGRQFLMLYSS